MERTRRRKRRRTGPHRLAARERRRTVIGRRPGHTHRSRKDSAQELGPQGTLRRAFPGIRLSHRERHQLIRRAHQVHTFTQLTAQLQNTRSRAAKRSTRPQLAGVLNSPSGIGAQCPQGTQGSCQDRPNAGHRAGLELKGFKSYKVCSQTTMKFSQK